MDVATLDDLAPMRAMSQPGGDQQIFDTRSRCVPAILLLEIQETHRQRQDLLRAELRLNNQIEAVYRRLTGLKAEQRARLHKQASTGEGPRADDDLTILADPGDDTASGGDQKAADTPSRRVPADFARLEAIAAIHCIPLVQARELLAASRKPLEKRLDKLAKDLPVWPWVAGVRGFGALGLAQIVAECGDLHNYAGPAKVWKRMGLAVMPDGTRQRRVTDAEAAALHGYSPQRRSLVYVIADALIKNNRDGAYRTYYLAEKERQREKLPDAPQAHIHNRALRHMSKRLLRDLWRAWRATGAMSPNGCLSATPATFLAAD